MSMKELAQHIIAVAHDENKKITNLQLQKVMYFTLKKMINSEVKEESELAQNNYLTGEHFLVWRYGPVIKDIYEKYSIYGADPITEQDEQINRFAFLNKYITSLIDENVFSLVEKTHEENFWKENSVKIIGWRSSIEYPLNELIDKVN